MIYVSYERDPLTVELNSLFLCGNEYNVFSFVLYWMGLIDTVQAFKLKWQKSNGKNVLDYRLACPLMTGPLVV